MKLAGQRDADTLTKYHGLNIKSLCEPAILPLSIDVLNQETLYDSEDFLLSPDAIDISDVLKKKKFATPQDCMIELVCQRLSREFQLVEGVDVEWKKLVGYTETQKSEFRKSNFILSMGHRVHFIMYSAFEQKICVYKAISKRACEIDNASLKSSYSYEVWAPWTNKFVTITQEFRQFQDQEYNWNYADRLLLLMETFDLKKEKNDALIKPKRLRYSLIPELLPQRRHYQGNTPGRDSGDAEPGESADDIAAATKLFFAKFEKIKALLKSKTNEDLAIHYVGPDESISSRSSAAMGDMASATIWLPNHAHEHKQWARIMYDTVVSPTTVFHLEVYWIACDSWLMDDFLRDLFVRCKSQGLRLVEVGR